MIVRILGEGQYQIPDEHRGGLDARDDRLQPAAEAGEETQFTAVRQQLLDTVLRRGTPCRAAPSRHRNSCPNRT